MQIGSFFLFCFKSVGDCLSFFFKELTNLRQARSKFLSLPGCAFTLLTGITQTLKIVNFLLFNSARADFWESTLFYACCLESASSL